MAWALDPIAQPQQPHQYSGSPDYVGELVNQARQQAEHPATSGPMFDPRQQMDIQTGNDQNPVTNPAVSSWALDPPPQKSYNERQPGFVEKKVLNQIPESFVKQTLQNNMGRVADVATGANDTLAGALSVPSAAIANVFRGALGQELLTSNDVKQTFQKYMKAIPGMGADKEQAFNKWWADLGDSAAQQAMMSMAIIAGAPALVAGGAKLGGTAGGIIKNLGETAITHPGMVAAADFGSAVGSKVLPETEDYLKRLGVSGTLANPAMLELVGSLVGGTLGGSLSTLARIRPGEVEGTYKGLPRFGGSLVKAAVPGAKPLVQPTFSSDDIGKAVRGVQLEAESWLNDRVSHITRNFTLDPAVQAQRVQNFLRTEGKAQLNRIEDGMWAEVNQRRPVPTMDPKAVAKEVSLSVAARSARQADIPGNIIDDIQRWGPATSMKDMRDVARIARAEAESIGLGTDRTLDTRAGNLTKIANSIDDAIEKAYPGDFNLAKAKEFTKWKHDQFSGSSPMANFSLMRKNPLRAPLDANTAFKTAMRDSRFPEQMADVGQTLGVTPELQGRSEDYLRSLVTDAYNTVPRPGLDPLREELYASTAAKEYMQSADFKRFAKAFPAMDSVFQRQTTQLQNAVGKAAQIAKSNFFNKAHTDPEAAVEALFNSGTKVRDTVMIMDNIGGNQKALDALQTAMIQKLGNSVNWDPTQMAARLNSKDLAQVFAKVYGKPSFSRLRGIIDQGAALQKGETGNLIGMSPSRTAGRILGTFFTGLSGGKSIQTHAIGAKIGGNVLQRIFHIIPPEYFVQKAVTDTNWERFLMSKNPTTMENFRTTVRLLSSMVSGVEEGHKLFSDQMNKQQEQFP